MKISTRSRYAIRALLCLTMKYDNGPMPLKKISETQKISVKYLENIMRLFINAGIVRSSKGKRGGFTLAKDPKKIKMSEVINIAEGNIFTVCCSPKKTVCPNENCCAGKEMLEGLRDTMTAYLDSWTLARLVERQKYFTRKSGKNSY
jgi:Rrf2 family protein